MAPQSSTLAWKIPCMEKPGRLQSMESLILTRLSNFNFTFMLGEGNSNPLQCSCLENPRDGGAWWNAVYGVTQSWTQLKRLSSSSYSAPLIHMSVFVPILHCFDSCSFVVLSEVWESDASCFVFIPQDCFGKSGTFRMAIIKKSTNNKQKRGCGEKGILLYCWWECKLVMQLWKTV